MSLSISHPSSSEPGAGSEKGFTLIEIVVAISILAIVLTSVYGIFSSVSVARGRLDADSADYHRARVIFDRLGRELRGAYFQPGQDNLSFIGEAMTDGVLQQLELTTTAVSPLSRTGSGVARVRYRLVRDQEDAAARRVLLRSEQPAYQPAEDEADADMMRLAAGIESMSIRYYANGEWQTDWEGRTAGRLPDMVELTLQVGTEEQAPVTFRSAFEVPRW